MRRYSMRKRIIGHGPGEVAAAEPGWLDLEHLVQVEITSEEVGYPIESALIPGTGSGWRGAAPEVEDYDVDLDAVTALELRIVPDISGGTARASLAQLRVA